jgi:hypothetical protein
MRLLIVSLVVILFAGFAWAQSADEKQVMELELAFEKAMNTKDSTAIAMVEKHAVDSTVTIDAFGNVMNVSRQDLVSMMKKTDPGVTRTYKQSNYKVQIDDKTAIVTYQVLFSASGEKNPDLNTTDFPDACMDVFIKRKNDWYGLATTCTPAKSSPQATYDAVAAQMQKK